MESAWWLQARTKGAQRLQSAEYAASSFWFQNPEVCRFQDPSGAPASCAPEFRGLRELGGSRVGWRELVDMEGNINTLRKEQYGHLASSLPGKRHPNFKDVSEPLR